LYQDKWRKFHLELFIEIFSIFIYRELYVERIEKKTDASAQRARQLAAEEKGLVSSIPLVTKTTDGDIPPDDLLCPLCKRLYVDAVITPCCHLNFCDACKIKFLI
jgi:hypothetical protein